MPDIFNRRALDFGGAFASDSASVNIAGINGVGLIVQQLSIQYQQPITRIYEVGTQKTYFIAGRPQGTATIASILGPGPLFTFLYQFLGDVCQAAGRNIEICMKPGCSGNENQQFNAIKIIAKDVVMQSIGMAIASQDMVLNQQMGLFFTSLHICDGECPPPDVVPDPCQLVPVAEEVEEG